jgi:biotin carboxyl carrier protein
MPGRVVEIRVKVGEEVTKGQVLLVLEAMKMRNEVLAPVPGVVATLRVEVGTNVRAGEPMVLLRPKP